MVLQMSRPFKHPKTGVYYFRKGVPERMRHLVRKREIKISLDTKDPSEAKRKNAILSTAVEAEWAKLVAAAESPPISLTQQQVVALSGRLYRSIIDEHGENPGVYFRREVTRGGCGRKLGLSKEVVHVFVRR